jgi:hypothetical protein
MSEPIEVLEIDEDALAEMDRADAEYGRRLQEALDLERLERAWDSE